MVMTLLMLLGDLCNSSLTVSIPPLPQELGTFQSFQSASWGGLSQFSSPHWLLASVPGLLWEEVHVTAMALW